MIQEAHVGLGLAGKEGRAAVRSSDYAFAKFKHLKRVLLVHGQWYYYRSAILVQYFFYKNMAAFACQFYFQFFSSFSTQNLFDSWSLTMYNIIYTSLPIFIFGLFEQNVTAQALTSQPQRYKDIARNRLLSPKQSLFWFADGVWMSLVNYFAFYGIWGNGGVEEVTSGGLDLLSYGFLIYFSVLFSVTFRLLVHARHWNWILLLSIAFTLAVVYIGTMLVNHQIPLSFDVLFIETKSYDVMFKSLASPTVWLAALWVLVVGLLPSLFVQTVLATPVLSGLFSGRGSSWRDLLTSQKTGDKSDAANQPVYYINVHSNPSAKIGYTNDCFENDEVIMTKL